MSQQIQHGDQWGRALYGARCVRLQGGRAQRHRQRTPRTSHARPAGAMELLAKAAQGRARRGPEAGRRACWRAAHVAKERVDAAREYRGAGPRLHALSSGCRLRLRHACADRQGLVPQGVLQDHPRSSRWRPWSVPFACAYAPRAVHRRRSVLCVRCWQRDRVFVCMPAMFVSTYVYVSVSFGNEVRVCVYIFWQQDASACLVAHTHPCCCRILQHHARGRRGHQVLISVHVLEGDRRRLCVAGNCAGRYLCY